MKPALLAAAFLLMASIAAAHHSFAMYNVATPMTLRGRVTQVRWVSPHAVFSVATDTATGKPSVVWTIELSSPANMARLGWSHSTLAIGDRIEVTISPMRDGTHGGACRQVRFLDASKMLECGAATAITVGEKPR